MALVEIIQQHSRVSIILIALLVSLFITIINYFFMNKEKMREIKSRQKELQKQIKEHQKAGNHAKMMDLNKEMMSQQMEMFKHSMVPMMITMVPIVLLFGTVREIFAETVIAKSWFWYYFITAIAGSMIFRKLFNLP